MVTIGTAIQSSGSSIFRDADMRNVGSLGEIKPVAAFATMACISLAAFPAIPPSSPNGMLYDARDKIGLHSSERDDLAFKYT